MKINSKIVFYTAVILLIFLAFAYSKTQTKSISSQVKNVIVTGEGNPGRVSIYSHSPSGFIKRSIDTGFRYVYTVRIGDAHQDGKNRIYAGVGNSFFAEPHGCQVLSFDPTNNFEKEIIDETGDLRCKDLTIGDANNDGKIDLVLGTHGEGIVKIFTKETNGWKKQIIEQNPVAIYDKETNQNHRVAKDKLPYDILVQTAVHIVKIGDADNDGKNEIVATISDPLEHPDKNHIAFWTIYKFNGISWDKEIIDTVESPIPFKATTDIVDIDQDGKNEVIVGASHHSLALYRKTEGKWQKQVVDQEEAGVEDNMKGVSVGNIENSKSKSIILATGIPQAAIYQYDLNNNNFTKKQLVNISDLLKPYKPFEGITDNSLDAKITDLDGDGKKEIVAGGISESSFMADKLGVTKFGWESTPLGFTIILSPKGDGTYSNQFLDFHSVLALDVGQIETK